jgi:exoribonuclease R
MIELKEGDVFVGQIEFSTNGNASLKIEDKEVFIYKKNTLNSLHLDKVKIEIFKAEKKLEGKVTEVVSRYKTEFVGKVQIGKKSTFVIPDSNRIPVDFYIKGGLVAEDNQKVIPPFGMNHLQQNYVGISFCVSKKFIAENNIKFTNDNAEDFKFLKEINDKGGKIYISPHITYNVNGHSYG